MIITSSNGLLTANAFNDYHAEKILYVLDTIEFEDCNYFSIPYPVGSDNLFFDLAYVTAKVPKGYVLISKENLDSLNSHIANQYNDVEKKIAKLDTLKAKISLLKSKNRELELKISELRNY